MKFIHCADIHFDSKINGIPFDKNKILKESVFKSFEYMVEFARENDVKAIIISGDMFDTDIISFKSKTRLINTISKYGDIDFLYLSGNHDEETLIKHMEGFPDNFKTFDERWSCYEYGDVVISGLVINDINKNSFYNSLLLNDEKINIVALHGEVVAGSGENSYSINIKKLRDKNIDYLALGHIHSHIEGRIDERGIYAYSGCLKGRGFDETGEKGFILLDVVDDKITSRFISLDFGGIYEEKFDVTNAQNFYTFSNTVIQKIKNNYTEKDVVKIVFIGNHNENFVFDDEYLLNQLNDIVLFAKIENLSKLELNELDFQNDKSLRGEFLRLVTADNSLGDEQKQMIIETGLKAFRGEV